MERKLRDLKPGDKGLVIKARNTEGSSRKLLDMGLVAGTPLEVIRTAPFGDPVEISIKGYNLTLRREEAEGVIVEVDKK